MTLPISRQREGYIEVPGGRVWYQVVGAGDAVPLLTLHGGPGATSDTLTPLQDLADERPVVFYDQLGGGRSDQPTDKALWRIERFVKELAQVRSALGLQQIHLLGQSWGTMLAVDYMLTQPAGVISLILSDPVLSVPRYLVDAAALRAELPREVQHVLHQYEVAGTTDSAEYEAAAMEFYKRFFCRLDPWPTSLEPPAAQVYATMWGPNEFTATGNLRDYDRTSQLEEISLPTLFICGRYGTTTPASTARYHQLVPRSELVIFEQSSHLPHFEEAERYLAVVRDFLKRAEWRAQTL
jgi:proline iminopeptidase